MRSSVWLSSGFCCVTLLLMVWVENQRCVSVFGCTVAPSAPAPSSRSALPLPFRPNASLHSGSAKYTAKNSNPMQSLLVHWKMISWQGVVFQIVYVCVVIALFFKHTHIDFICTTQKQEKNRLVVWGSIQLLFFFFFICFVVITNRTFWHASIEPIAPTTTLRKYTGLRIHRFQVRYFLRKQNGTYCSTK